MSRSNYLISLIDAFTRSDEETFYEDCLSLIEYEKENKNYKVAKTIEKIIKNKKELNINSSASFQRHTSKYLDFDKSIDGTIDDLVDIELPKNTLKKVILNERTKKEIYSFVDQWLNKERLSKYNLASQTNLLIYGAPGTGKTLTAKAIASELDLELVYLNFDNLITSYLGNTATNIGRVFDYISNNNCVLLIDELDAIGKQRSDRNELGELKRVLISLLQNLDSFSGRSIIIACTNYKEVIDEALLRRFHKTIFFPLPGLKERKELIEEIFDTHYIPTNKVNYLLLSKITEGFTPNEIENSITSGIRNWIITNEQEGRLLYYVLMELTNSSKLKDQSKEGRLELAKYLKESSKIFTYDLLEEMFNVPKSTLHKKMREGGAMNETSL